MFDRSDTGNLWLLKEDTRFKNSQDWFGVHTSAGQYGQELCYLGETIQSDHPLQGHVAVE